MRDKYKKQVALLIRIMPSVYRIKEFAVHGGTAIPTATHLFITVPGQPTAFKEAVRDVSLFINDAH